MGSKIEKPGNKLSQEIPDRLPAAGPPSNIQETRNGIRLIPRPANAPVTTMAEVNRLRDEE
jgi:hypothetical protein